MEKTLGLHRLSPSPGAHRRTSSRGGGGGDSRGCMRSQRSLLSVCEIQELLREKIRANLKTLSRVFRLFDLNRTGHIQKHDFHRIMDHYCVQLTDREFNRLWSHYSLNASVSYHLFLETLGFGNSENFHMAPVCTKIEVSSRGSDQSLKPSQTKSRPESQPSTSSSSRTLHSFYNNQAEQLQGSPRSALPLGQEDPSCAVDSGSRRKKKKSGSKKLPVHTSDRSQKIHEENTMTMFTKHQSFGSGQERSLFLSKLKGSTEKGCEDKRMQSLDAMKIQIKNGDNDRRFVDVHEFRAELRRLRLSCSGEELQRLLHQMNLKSKGKQACGKDKPPTPTAANMSPENLQQLLSSEACSDWSNMSKVVCEENGEGQSYVHKSGLRKLLFAVHNLPITQQEFEQLWARFDPGGLGSVAVCDFLEKLGFHHKDRKEQNQEQGRPEAARPNSAESVTMEKIRQVLVQNSADFSKSLVHLSDGRDRSATAKDLLSLLHKHQCSVGANRMLSHLHRFKESKDESSSCLSDMDFLSAFEPKPEKTTDRPPVSPDSVQQIRSLEKLSPGATLTKMEELVTASAPLLYEAFSSLDPSDSGRVTALDFKKVLETFCGCLSDRQFRLILTRLDLDRDSVNWKDFLYKFYSEGRLSKLSSRPGTSSGRVNRSLSAGAGRPSSRSSSDRIPPDHRPKTAGPLLIHSKWSAEWEPQPPAFRPQTGLSWGRGVDHSGVERGLRVEGCIRAAVRTSWRHILNNCSNTDTQKDGRISTDAFLKILECVQLRVTEEQLMSLHKDFIREGQVYYHEFLQHFLLDLRPDQTRTKTRLRQRLPLPTDQSRVTPSPDFAAVMLRIYPTVRSCWTPLRRDFLSADLQRSGKVSVGVFRKLLSRFVVVLSADDWFHLVSYFDPSASGTLCYNSFLWAFIH